MKLGVDFEVCEANGVCVRHAPEVFRLDDEDNLWLLEEDIPPELQARVRDAVDGCPKAALYLED